jgi:hypothetical protein
VSGGVWTTLGIPLVVAVCAALVAAGCTGVGPKTVARDRFDYVSAISESWKRQNLLNLVKMRYADAPVFMDVTSVISQYAVEGEINLSATWADSPIGNSQSVGGTGRYTDRPTITYSPVAGERFTRSYMTPIPLSGVLFMLQSGYSADLVMRICVHTINGIENQYGGLATGKAADPRFLELIQAMRRLQEAGGLGMRVRPEGDTRAIVMFFRQAPDPAFASDLQTIRELLGLDPEAREFEVVYGSFPANGKEIAILTRSMLQVTIDFSSFIDVPAAHVQEGRVMLAKTTLAGEEQGFPRLVRIRSSESRVEDAYAAVRYRDHWFYIDDRDYVSKVIFYFYMLLSSLTETGGQAAAPIVTVPTN